MKEIFKPQRGAPPEPDSFDQWVSAQSETLCRHEGTLNYISSQIIRPFGPFESRIVGQPSGYGNSGAPSA